MRADLILRIAAKLIVPLMLLFALYVQFHGDYGPGGGFQAGVIAAAAVILYALVNGMARTARFLPLAVIEMLIPLGVILFAGVGLVGILTGRNYLDYSNLAGDPVHGQEWGVFLVELGVFVTVASTMLAIFYVVAGRERR